MTDNNRQAGFFHKTVLLKETIDLLKVKPEKHYVDGTLGGGGHTGEILERGGKVLSIDLDQDALDYSETDLRFKIKDLRIGENLILVQGNFKDIEKIVKENEFDPVAGVLVDLGVSSHQIDEGERGFSFMNLGPLDMRMDRNLNVKAGDLVNILTKGELYELFNKLGEDYHAKAIASAIVSARQVKKIETTWELSEIVRKVVRSSGGKINPATKVFQALRIAINDELNSLRDFLPRALDVIEEGGRIAIISFHSLEDRIVKNEFKKWAEIGKGIIVTKKPIAPGDEEIDMNPRSRSAKLRVFEKI